MAIVRIIIGLVFGAISAIALSPAIAAFSSEDGSGAGPAVLIVVLVGAVFGYFAPTIRRAFGRGFLMLGAATFALPISALLLSGRAASEVVSQAEQGSEAFAAAGAGLGAVAVTGAATFFGFILGSIFLIIGLILALGGRREVIVVHPPLR